MLRSASAWPYGAGRLRGGGVAADRRCGVRWRTTFDRVDLDHRSRHLDDVDHHTAVDDDRDEHADDGSANVDDTSTHLTSTTSTTPPSASTTSPPQPWVTFTVENVRCVDGFFPAADVVVRALQDIPDGYEANVVVRPVGWDEPE